MHLSKTSPSQLASGDNIVGNVIVDATATIGKDCKIGMSLTYYSFLNCFYS